jgi:hypothetical protein
MCVIPNKPINHASSTQNVSSAAVTYSVNIILKITFSTTHLLYYLKITRLMFPIMAHYVVQVVILVIFFFSIQIHALLNAKFYNIIKTTQLNHILHMLIISHVHVNFHV